MFVAMFLFFLVADVGCQDNPEENDPWPMVRWVAFSPDGNALAVATTYLDDESISGEVLIYDVSTGKTLNRWPEYEDYLMSCAWSPDGNSLATGSYTEGVVVRDVLTGKVKPGFGKSGGRVMSVCFSPDGSTIASGALTGNIVFWNAKNGQKRFMAKHVDGRFNGIQCVTFSPDGKILVSAGSGKLKIWNSETGEEVASLDAHGSYQINGVSFSRNGKLIASASIDQTVKIWDSKEFTELRSLIPTDMAYSTAFSADDTKLYSTDETGELAIWSVASGDRLGTWKGHTNAVYHIAISPNGKLLASASHDQTARLWDVETGQVIHILRPVPLNSR